jgi:hypothetical protein
MTLDPARKVDPAQRLIQASENGGEPTGRWWGPGARALGFESGKRLSASRMTCCSASVRPLTAPGWAGLLHHVHLVLTKGDSHRLAEALTGKGVIPLAT